MSSAVSSCARKPRDQLRINSSASLLPTIDSMLAGTFATSACSWQISVSVTDMQNSLPQGRLLIMIGLPDSGSFAGLRSRLLHHLTHGGDMAWCSPFAPGLVAVRGFLQVGEEQWIREPLAAFRYGRLHALPHEEELAAVGFEEQIFV